MGLIRLDKINHSKIIRLSTGFPYLDKVFGVTKEGGLDFYGMPRGRIVFASGEAGVGKTRLAISVVKSINSYGGKILIFQGEVRPEEFKQWTGTNVFDETNFFVSDDRKIEQMVDYIKQEKPTFVTIDSANMIEDYNRSSAIRVILDSLKDTVADIGCVCLMIGHLTKDGKLKGNADVGHLVDVECSVKKLTDPKIKSFDGLSDIEKFRGVLWQVPGMFKIEIRKNRYGSSGGWATFQHTDEGIDFIDSSFGVNQDFFKSCLPDKEQDKKKQGFWSWLSS